MKINTEELDAVQEQTNEITSNLEYIEENTPNDLEDMAEQTGAIAWNLKYIEENVSNELEELEERTGIIAANLKAITDDETVLDDLEERLDRIIAKLETVNDCIRSDAEAYRLKQAEDLLREAGYVQGVDGNWTLPT
jgi:DNA repair exonuclease SbcCD ATPase subunit